MILHGKIYERELLELLENCLQYMDEHSVHNDDKWSEEVHDLKKIIEKLNEKNHSNK